MGEPQSRLANVAIAITALRSSQLLSEEPFPVLQIYLFPGISSLPPPCLHFSSCRAQGSNEFQGVRTGYSRADEKSGTGIEGKGQTGKERVNRPKKRPTPSRVPLKIGSTWVIRWR